MSIGPDSAHQKKEEFRRLRSLKLLPPECEFAIYSNEESPTKGLLAAWKVWLRYAPANRRSRAARVHSWLHAVITNGAELSFEVLGRDKATCERWLGQRAYWWPDGTLISDRVGIVSSRLKRDPTMQAPILRALRLSMSTIDLSKELLVTSAGTSLFGYAEQYAATLATPLLRVHTPGDQSSVGSWLDLLIQNSDKHQKFELLISPECPARDNSDTSRADSPLRPVSQLPVRDRVLALLSRKLVLLNVRRNGNWWKILHAGFIDGLWDAGLVRTVVGTGLCSASVASAWQEYGAVPWYLEASEELIQNHDRQTCDPEGHNSLLTATAAARDQTPEEDALLTELIHSESTAAWLLHWTRASRSEWSGESTGRPSDNAVMDDSGESRTAFGILKRIIKEQTVRATSGNNRTATNVVCFTEVPLAKLVQERIFRAHRGRWDFEHYGIGIRTLRLRSLGTRPVIYGDEQRWRSLPEGERPWFQPLNSQTGKTKIDWTIEGEWRLTSDLNLANLRTDEVFIFCRTDEEAVRLRAVCDWRVVSIEALNSRLEKTDT